MAGKVFRDMDEPRPGELPDVLRPLHMHPTGRRFWRWYLVFCLLCLAGGIWAALP